MTEAKQLHPRLDALLAEYGTPRSASAVIETFRATEHPCEGTKFHSPVPVLTQQFVIDSREVHLCPTCASKLVIFIHLVEVAPQALTWDVLREFGNQVRLLGQAYAASVNIPIGTAVATSGD